MSSNTNLDAASSIRETQKYVRSESWMQCATAFWNRLADRKYGWLTSNCLGNPRDLLSLPPLRSNSPHPPPTRFQAMMLSEGQEVSDSNILRRARLTNESKSDSTRNTHEHAAVLELAGDEGPSTKNGDDINSNVAQLNPKAKESLAKKGSSKVLFLDGVRGLAAILVVTQHSGYMNENNLGANAVDTFFVLSSFLLTMLFEKKSRQLLAMRASYRKWFFTMVDYFSKRFFRVYPLFAIIAVVLWVLPFKYKKQYFMVKTTDHYNLFEVLTFDFQHRYHVFWTLPLEITYYFMIPVFVLGVIHLRRFWWVPFIPLYIWVINAGVHEFRTSHHPLAPHLPTFLSGSMAAIIYVNLDAAIKRSAFEFRTWHKLLVRIVEFCIIGGLLSVCFNGLFFRWIHDNPVPKAKGFPYVSLHVTAIIVIEMVQPSAVARMFEWSVLRHWGKIGFSVYLLHSFVIYTGSIRRMPYYDRCFAQFGLIFLLATASYHLVEYPCQLLAQRISKALARREGITVQTAYLPVTATHHLDGASAQHEK